MSFEPEKPMLRNVGIIDRWLRVTLGSVLLLMTLNGTLAIVWGWVALVPFITGVLGYCPLYHVLGWSTRRRHGSAYA